VPPNTLSKRKTVPQRILFGIVALAVLFFGFWGDAEIARRSLSGDGPSASLLAHGSLIPLMTVLFCLLGSVEFARLLRNTGASPCVGVGQLFIVLSILGPWLAAGLYCGGSASTRGWYATVVVVGLGMLCCAAALVMRRRIEGVTRDAGATLLLFTYLGVLPGFAIHIRSGIAGPGPAGAWLVLATLFVIKASDIGAYLTGTFLGRHKLAPAISPGKSIEGALGGVLFSGLVAVLFLHLGSTEGNVVFGRVLPPELHTNGWASSIYAFFFGATLSAIGQIGDLLESCFKRDAGIKDSGRVLPRFGGMLDLVDSPLLALPAAWLILTWVWPV